MEQESPEAESLASKGFAPRRRQLQEITFFPGNYFGNRLYVVLHFCILPFCAGDSRAPMDMRG
jgi:hypothetical protein